MESISLSIMDTSFRKLGEVPIFSSLSIARSYYGVGSWSVTVPSGAPGADLLQPDVILFPGNDSARAMICEECTVEREQVTAKGFMLKGIAMRRIAVPPLSLPTRLWKYTGSKWEEITDADIVRNAILNSDVYQGFSKPQNPPTGMLWLDLTEIGGSYDWGTDAKSGQVILDLGTAELRNKYQNFGWDRFVGDAESAYHHFVKNNITAPEDPKRVIPRVILGENLHRGIPMPWQARFDKLDALFSNIGQATGLGWDVRPNFEKKAFVFDAWQGRDYASGRTGRIVVISEDMGNAENMKYRKSLSASATTVYIGGAGEDENRFIFSVGNETAGLGRRELWAEASGVDDIEMLTMFGESKLTSASEKETLTAEMIDSGACRYGRDYDVGDELILSGGLWKAKTRLIEMREVYENDARKLSATFGDTPITIADAISRGAGAAR